MENRRPRGTRGNLYEKINFILASINNAATKRYESTFGMPISDLAQSPDIVREHLKSENPETRSLALTFLQTYASRSLCVQSLSFSAEHDGADQVRVTALSLIGIMLLKEKDKQMIECLLRIILDNSKVNTIRKRAYLALCPIDRNGNLNNLLEFRFPEEIDWEFISHI